MLVISGYVAAALANATPPLHLLMSKSVKNLKQMLLEGDGLGCGVAVQGASRDVELVSWPHTSAGAMHRERERESS